MMLMDGTQRFILILIGKHSFNSLQAQTQILFLALKRQNTSEDADARPWLSGVTIVLVDAGVPFP